MKRFCRPIVLLLLLLVALPTGAFATSNPVVVLETNFGDISIELYPADAPITVDNFLSYVNSGFYDSLLFHRVIDGFMIQAGRFLYYNGQFYYRNPGDSIVNESYNGLLNLRGTIAMARTDEPDSATAQFFINHIDNTSLDRVDDTDVGYCVFGNVTEGMDVVDDIAVVPTTYVQYVSDDFPYDPMVGIYAASVLPCDTVECSDLNGNGTVDFADMAIIASHWLNEDCGSDNEFCDSTDFDYNGIVNEADMMIFANNWLSTVPQEPPTEQSQSPAE